jgi:protein-L-isoaspartate(D-aspartate) O-methyltransferase
MNRRDFLASSAVAVAGGVLPTLGLADVSKQYDWSVSPPFDSRAKYIAWMQANRGEDPKYLGLHWDRYDWMLNRAADMWGDANKRAFLLTPREEFCLKQNLEHVYDIDFLDIGYGVTISGPGLVGRMTCTLDVKKGDKVLEIGTGSGYQSAFLSNLTDKVWTIEIIQPLADRTRGIYDALIRRGYTEYAAINTRRADGYYGWEEAAPFDKIIVTCGIDHIPPPLLQQLKIGGVMVAPIGPPGAQHVLKINKNPAADGTITVARSDIYGGRVIPFVPFTALAGDVVKGTHDK